MLNTQRIKSIFPSDWAVIIKRCGNDPEMFEICADLDSLIEDIETAENGTRFMSNSLKADVLISKEALVQEVREKLNLSWTR